MLYEVKVAYTNEDGKVKKETLLTKAVSITDSEAKVVAHLTEVGETRDFEVIASKESSISEIVPGTEETTVRPSKEEATVASEEDSETPF